MTPRGCPLHVICFTLSLKVRFQQEPWSIFHHSGIPARFSEYIWHLQTFYLYTTICHHCACPFPLPTHSKCKISNGKLSIYKPLQLKNQVNRVSSCFPIQWKAPCIHIAALSFPKALFFSFQQNRICTLVYAFGQDVLCLEYAFFSLVCSTGHLKYRQKSSYYFWVSQSSQAGFLRCCSWRPLPLQ